MSGIRPTCGGNNNNSNTNNRSNNNTSTDAKPLQPVISEMSSHEDIAADDQEIDVCSDEEKTPPTAHIGGGFTAERLLSLTGGSSSAAVKLSHAFSIAALMKK